MVKRNIKLPNVYEFVVFKSLVEIELRRVRAYNRDTKFSIGFFYSPEIAEYIRSGNMRYLGFLRKLKQILKEPDVLTPVEEDFIFFFFPDITREEAEEKLKSIKELFRGKNIIDGIASYPEDGKTEQELFNKLVQIMNEKLIPVIQLYEEKGEN